MSGRGKVSEERELSLWTELTEEALWKTESLSSTLKKVIRGKLGEGERNLTLQHRREQKTKAPKPEWAKHVWELMAAASICWVPTKAGSFIYYY